MKKLFFFLLSLVLVTAFSSCKRDSEIINPNPGDTTGGASTGAVTPVATPIGIAVTATIGAAGGSIESEDKRIRVDIPAGALTSNQTISVQTLDNNHCPAGTGQGFRLLPHGVIFAKPATITYRYDEADVKGSHPALLQVAYQNDKHIWQNVAVKSIDTLAHAISVQTTHFSDWSLFQLLSLEPEFSMVNPGSTVHLTIKESYPTEKGELSVPRVGTDSKRIQKWTLAGAGTLTHEFVKGNYYAPESIPAVNPASVTVFLNLPPVKDETGHSFSDLRLVANIYVAPEGISYQLDGSGWKTFPGGANLKASQSVLLGSIGNDYVSLTWPGNKPGIYHWVLGTQVAFNLLIGPKIYQHVYIENKKPKVSGGTLVVQQITNNGVFGTFTVKPSGWINPSAPTDPAGTSTINGVFRLKTVN